MVHVDIHELNCPRMIQDYLWSSLTPSFLNFDNPQLLPKIPEESSKNYGQRILIMNFRYLDHVINA